MNTFLKSFYKLAGLAEVSTVAVLDGDKILMGKRRDNERWTNPGGHLNPGEDPLDGAVRELFEESGIKADKNKLVHLKTEKVTTPKGKKLIIHAYKVSMPGVKTSMKNDPDQEVYRWNWINTAGGLPKDILEHLHSPKNVLLKALGLLEQEKTADIQRSLRRLRARREGRDYDAADLLAHEKSAMSPGKIHELAQSGLTKRMLDRAIKFPHANTTGGRSQWEAVDEAAKMLSTAKDKKPVMEAVNRMYPKSEKVAEMNKFWGSFEKRAVMVSTNGSKPKHTKDLTDKERERVHRTIATGASHIGAVGYGGYKAYKALPEAAKKVVHHGLGGYAVGGILGGLGGSVISHALLHKSKHEKKADVSKEELREELRKHEERETPAQEAAESKSEQKIEREAGVEPAEHLKKAFMHHFEKAARKLSYKARENLPSGDFVFPKERKYPIHDKNHARNALARASGKPEEAKVRAAVKRKFPDIE